MKKHEYLMHMLGVDCLDSFGDFRDIIHIHIGYTIKDNSSCFDLYTTKVNTGTLMNSGYSTQLWVHLYGQFLNMNLHLSNEDAVDFRSISNKLKENFHLID